MKPSDTVGIPVLAVSGSRLLTALDSESGEWTFLLIDLDGNVVKRLYERVERIQDSSPEVHRAMTYIRDSGNFEVTKTDSHGPPSTIYRGEVSFGPMLDRSGPIDIRVTWDEKRENVTVIVRQPWVASAVFE